MDSKIKYLFDETYKIAERVQKIDQSESEKKIDGRAIWGKIEEKVKDIKIENLEYNENLNPIYEEMNKIMEKYDMHNNEMNPKLNHFFMQLKNLVVTKSNFKIYLNRVLQLAYNAGQLSVFLENIENFADKEKLNEINKIVMKHKLNILNTYVSNENQNKINKILENIDFSFDDVNSLLLQNPMTGGRNYKEKYLKYKQKYMNLKYSMFFVD
jgi:hypothetical protein